MSDRKLHASSTERKRGWPVRAFAKFLIALGLITAGAALAQTAKLPAPVKAVDVSKKSPKLVAIDDVPMPGSQREARACSEDIRVLCAPDTKTRRNVRECLKDRAKDVSKSCNAFLSRSTTASPR